MATVVPFHELIGIEVLEACDGRSRVRAPDTPALKNHFGTMHGGMLFTLGEISAAMAVTRTLADKLAALRAVTKSAEIRYLKPAKGAITGEAELQMTVADLLEQVEVQKSVDLPITVSLRDDSGQEVASLVAVWYVAKSRPRSG